jgi:D-aminopeptidase
MKKTMGVPRILRVLAAACLVPLFAHAAEKPRARDLGIPFDGAPGPLDAITDVRGVVVGHSTIIRGQGALKVGEGPVRTGVTAVLPRGKSTDVDPVFAGWFALNGAGEMTGTTWVEESGFLEGPVMLTNTHSVGAVHEATIAWRVARGRPNTTGSTTSTASTSGARTCSRRCRPRAPGPCPKGASAGERG